MVEQELPQAVEQPEAGQGKKAKAPKAKKEKPPKVKKEKPAKAPKAKKEKPPKQQKAPKGAAGGKPAKEKGSFPGVLLLAALLTALLITAGGLIFFNLFAARTTVINALASLDSEYSSYNGILAARDTALNDRETDIAAKEQDLQQREDKLVSNETRLNNRAADLDAREKKLAQQERDATPLFRREISAEKLSELKNLGKIYSNMDAEAAAKILTQLYGPVEMAEVLFYMDKNAAAAVLAALKPELAAQITTEMLRE